MRNGQDLSKASLDWRPRRVNPGNARGVTVRKNWRGGWGLGHATVMVQTAFIPSTFGSCAMIGTHSIPGTMLNTLPFSLG